MKDNTIAIFCGSRPEVIKCKPLINELNKRGLPNLLVLTGQQKDLLSNEEYDFKFQIKNQKNTNRLNSLLSQIVLNVDKFLVKHSDVTNIICQGDTTTALGVGLATAYARKKLIYIESGLRTHDFENPFPEEGNRQLISRIADIHFCPTEQNKINLDNEGVLGKKFVVGNTGIDKIVDWKDKCFFENKILVTLHRRENHDIMDQWFKKVNDLAIKYGNYEFLLPIHPNPNVLKHKHLLRNITIVNPLDHESLLNYLIKCKLVISDSGSLQEEASFLKKKMIVCRKTTERPEALGLTSFLCETPDMLNELFDLHINDPLVIDHICPYGDGTSSKKIVDILQQEIYS